MQLGGLLCQAFSVISSKTQLKLLALASENPSYCIECAITHNINHILAVHLEVLKF